jgi:D-tyrosyl-tRNA(Tyr) deacylase
MRAVVQRVSRAEVRVDGVGVGRIGRGSLVLLGIGQRDGAAEVAWMVRKLAALRIFPDADGRMNRSLEEVGGAMLIVSQFTLYGDVQKGRRPSYTGAAPPELAAPLVDDVAAGLRARGIPVECGRFGAMMEVELVNQGPVTILLETGAGAAAETAA